MLDVLINDIISIIVNVLEINKDKIDIIGLLDSVAIDWDFLKSVDDKYKKVPLINELKEILASLNKVDELSISEHRFSKLRRKILVAKLSMS